MVAYRKTKRSGRSRYLHSITVLKNLKQWGIAAGGYTQTTGVEGGINGLITHDREVQKLPPQILNAIAQPLRDNDF